MRAWRSTDARERARGRRMAGLILGLLVILAGASVALAVQTLTVTDQQGKRVTEYTVVIARLETQDGSRPYDPELLANGAVPGGPPYVARGNGNGVSIPPWSRAGRGTVFWTCDFASFQVGGWDGPRAVALQRPSRCVLWDGDCEDDIWLTIQPAPAVQRAQAAATPSDLGAQWAFKKLGLPFSLDRARLTPITVAVIDTGLDYRNPHFPKENHWRNPEPGADPEFAEDRFGWNFIDANAQPWDDNGHGTFVAGLVIAVNPAARIMPLKVMRNFGGGFSSDMSRAIVYAVDRGARVINVSLGAQGLSKIAQAAVDYARARGALVVAASGNDGVDTAGFGPAGLHGVLTVAATDPNDKKPPFGNWGQQVALAAPGVDIVSLRAAGTDFVLVASGGKDYTAGANIIGADRWLFRATGTSFAAPFVTGAASLLLSRDPNLTPDQVERMLVQSAADVETPGWDQFTGAGRLDIARALQADPNDYLTARVGRIGPGRDRGQPVIQVFGTVDGNRLERYEVQLGQGAEPRSWKTVITERGRPVDDGLLGAIPFREITAKGRWTVRVLAYDAARKVREARGTLNVE